MNHVTIRPGNPSATQRRNARTHILHTSTCGRQQLRKKLAKQGITATHVLHFRELTSGVAWPTPLQTTNACGRGRTCLIMSQKLKEFTRVDNHVKQIIEPGRSVKPTEIITVGSRQRNRHRRQRRRNRTCLKRCRAKGESPMKSSMICRQS